MEILGQKLAQYEILERLGIGGMGEVYKAHDSRLGRTVAIKILPTQVASDQEVRRRFLNEARAASALNHPYILTVYEIGTTDEYEYIVMEFVRGITLRERLGRGLLSLNDTLSIFAKLVEGLYKAHEAKIIHRDLKPENVMLTDDGYVKILDFGLAKMEQKFAEIEEDEIKTDPNVIQGTIGYLAPEIIQAQPGDIRTDIFALGVMLYECLAGRVPFPGKNLGERLVATMQREPTPISDFREDLPSELEDIIKNTLAKDPNKRYQTLAPVLEKLRALKLELDLEASLSGDNTPAELLDKLRRIQDSSETSHSEIKKAINAATTEGLKVGVNQPVHASANLPTVSMYRSRLRWYLIGGTLILVGSFMGWWYFQPTITDPLTINKTTNNKISLAVIYFENISQDEDLKWLERGLPEMLTTNLAQIEKFDIISSQQLYELLRRVRKKDSSPIDRTTVLAVARQAHVNAFVTGSIVKVGSKIRLTVTLEETQTGKILFSDKVDGESVNDIFAIVDKITLRLAEHLGVIHSGEKHDISIADVTTDSVAAYKHYELGIENLFKLYLNDATQEFQSATTIDPKFAMAYLQLGLARYRGGDDKGMREAITRAVELSDNVAPRERLYIHGLQAFIEGQTQKNIEIFKQLTERYPNDKEAHRQLGLAYLTDEQIDPAIVSFENTLKIDPDYAEGHNQLAYANILKDNYEKALEHAQKYVQLRPDEPNPHDTLGDVYLHFGQYNKALAEYQQITEIKPDFLNYFSLWKSASTYRAMGNLAEAEASYKKQLSLRKGVLGPDSTKSLAMITLLKGEREQTINYLKASLQEDTGQGMNKMALLTAIELGLLYTELGDLNQAQPYFDKAKQLVADPLLQMNVGARSDEYTVESYYIRLLLAQKQFDKIEAEIESFLKKRATLYTPHSQMMLRQYAQALIAEAKGNYAEALGLWQQLASQTSTNMHYYEFHKAFCLYNQGRLAEAKPVLELLASRPVLMHHRATNPIGVDEIMLHCRIIYYLGKIAVDQSQVEVAQGYFHQIVDHWSPKEINIFEVNEAAKALIKN